MGQQHRTVGAVSMEAPDRCFEQTAGFVPRGRHLSRRSIPERQSTVGGQEHVLVSSGIKPCHDVLHVVRGQAVHGGDGRVPSVQAAVKAPHSAVGCDVNHV